MEQAAKMAAFQVIMVLVLPIAIYIIVRMASMAYFRSKIQAEKEAKNPQGE